MRWGAKHSPTNRNGRNPGHLKDVRYNSSTIPEIQNKLFCKTYTDKTAFLIGGRMICWVKLETQKLIVSVHATCTAMCKASMDTTSKYETWGHCYNPSSSSPRNTVHAQGSKYKCRIEDILSAASKKQSGRRLTPAGRRKSWLRSAEITGNRQKSEMMSP